MTLPEFLQMLSFFGYASIFFLVLAGMFLNIFFLYDESAILFYQNKIDEAWLHILVMPLELCVAIIYFKFMVEYIAL